MVSFLKDQGLNLGLDSLLFSCTWHFYFLLYIIYVIRSVMEGMIKYIYCIVRTGSFHIPDDMLVVQLQ